MHFFYANLRPVCPTSSLNFSSGCLSFPVPPSLMIKLIYRYRNVSSCSADLNRHIYWLALSVVERKAQGIHCTIARRYFGHIFVPSPIFIDIQTGNNDCCPQFVATHLVYFGTVPSLEKHEMDHRSLKQHLPIWGHLIVVTVVKMLSKQSRNVSRTDKLGCVNIGKCCRDWWVQSMQPSVWSPF